MSKCERCNRTLKDPESIGRGYGPVCWRKIGGGGQAEHKKPFQGDQADRSDYDYRLDTHNGEPVVVIHDLDKGGMSVTNNIDAVVARIGSELGVNIRTGAAKIIYRDSDGTYDGVRFDGDGALEIYSLVRSQRITDEAEAMAAVRQP